MASGYSGETQCSTYIVQRLYYSTSADATGHNVYVELQMRRTNAYSGATYAYPSNSYIAINGDRYDWSWSNSSYPSIPGNNTNWIAFASRTVHVNHTTAATIGIAGGNYNMGNYLNGETSYSITLEAINVAPSGHKLDNVVRLQDGFTMTGGITSWGNPSTAGSVRFGVAESAITTGGVAQYTESITSKTGTVTVNENSTKTNNPTFSIIPNKMYHLGIYATNGTLGSYGQDWQYTTLPPTTTISNVGVTENTADFTYSVPNQGGKYDMTLKYQLDSGSLVTVTTLTGSGTKAGTFTVSGLQPGSTHTITASLTTSAGEVVSNTVTFTTDVPASVHKLYGSVNNARKQVDKMYFPWGVLIGASADDPQEHLVSFDSNTFVNKFNQNATYRRFIGQNHKLTRFVLYHPSATFRFEIVYKTPDGITGSINASATTSAAQMISTLAQWGISFGDALPAGNFSYAVNLSGDYTYTSKKIDKLYGSVNGARKLIFEGAA